MRKILGWLALAIGLFLVGSGVYVHFETGRQVTAAVVPGLVLLILAAVTLVGRRSTPRRW